MAYKLAFERFSSINSLVHANATKQNNKAFNGRERSSDEKGDIFSGTKTYEEAQHVISTGWEEPLSQLKGFTKTAVKTNTQAEKRRPSTGIIGYAPCVPNAIIGLPNSMISTETVRQKVKAVTIIYGTSVPCSWSTKELIDAGITMLKIVNQLELQGIRVKLTVEAMSTFVDNDLSTLWVDVKDWREALDLKKLTFPVANPSMLRRIAFRWLETYEAVVNTRFVSGYGQPLGNKDYGYVVKEYKDLGLLSDSEYYINAQLCRECEYEPDEVIKRAGMTELIQK